MIKRINLKSEFLKYIVILMSGTLIAQIINLALSIPLLKYFYSPEEMGELGLYLRIVGVGGALATARYDFAIPLTKANVHGFRLYHIALRTAVMVVLFTSLALVIPILLSDKIDDQIFFLLIPIGLFLAAYYSIGTNWAIRTKKYKSISISKVTNTSAGGGLKLLFGYLGFSYIGLLIATVVGLFLSNIWFIRDYFTAKKTYNVRFKSPRTFLLAKQYDEFPKVNLPHTLMDLGRDLLLAVLIIEFFSMDDFGLFDQSYRVLKLPLTLAGLAISQVFFQRCSDMYNRGEDITPLVVKSVKILALISIVPFTLIFLFGGDIFAYVFSEKWREAGEFSEIMAPWFMMNFIASPVSFLPLVLRKQRQFFLIAAVGSLILLLSTYIPAQFFSADVRSTFWVVSIGQTAYFVFLIFKILDYTKKSKLAPRES